MSCNLLKRVGIEDTCSLILDRYHLLEVDWKKKFGWQWQHLSSILSALVYAKTEEYYTLAFNAVQSCMTSTDLQEYLVNELHAHRKHLVDYWIKQYPYNLD